MNQLLKTLRIDVSPGLYKKDPLSSEVGQKILQITPELVLRLGIDQFTFKKLALEINVTEGAVYRYFENKQRLLLYLISWYWRWLEHCLVMELSNIVGFDEKLDKCLIRIIEGPPVEKSNFVNLHTLRDLIIEESVKAYFGKEVYKKEKEPFYSGFSNFANRICENIKQKSPQYPHPKILSVMIIEAIIQQQYYKRHLPELTDLHGDVASELEFFKNVIVKTIEPNG